MAFYNLKLSMKRIKFPFFNIYIILLFINNFSVYGDGFCTSKNLSGYCGVDVLEYKIDSGKISPALNCTKIFFWIPPLSTGEEKCYICADYQSKSKLEAILDRGSSKKCGKVILAGKKL
jgi:hypothetical protein